MGQKQSRGVVLEVERKDKVSVANCSVECAFLLVLFYLPFVCCCLLTSSFSPSGIKDSIMEEKSWAGSEWTRKNIHAFVSIFIMQSIYNFVD